jgi:hypothetical protein
MLLYVHVSPYDDYYVGGTLSPGNDAIRTAAVIYY